MRVIQIIPVRMGSTRFPGKPLKRINGTPMIEIIYNNISKTKKIYKTYVATCDKEIIQFCLNKKINVINTSRKHKRASDRCAEAFFKLEKKYKLKFDIMVMVQGDEPMINSSNISKAIEPFKKNRKLLVVNLMNRIDNKLLFEDQNCVKVVCNSNNDAIYFSRSKIPNNNNLKTNKCFKQVCVIPFSRKGIIKYMKLKPTILEKIESIDMLRFIENNIKVNMVEINNVTQPVDSLKDLKKVEKLINIK